MGLAQLKDEPSTSSLTTKTWRKKPWMAFVLYGVASAGIPPLLFIAGSLISVAYEAKLYLSLVALVIGVVTLFIIILVGFARFASSPDPL